MINPRIKNLIFDLGGVILNLSIETTIRILSERSKLSIDDILKIYHQSPELLNYEKGLINDQDFRLAMQRIFSFRAPDEEIDALWNAMLLDIPGERVELLKKLRPQFKLFLLSNTNSIHLESYSRRLSESHGLPSLDHLFDKAYYSHLMKMRKPDMEIYRRVLEENNLQASETLFLDDNLSNLDGAKVLGIQTFHVKHPDLIFSLFQ